MADKPESVRHIDLPTEKPDIAAGSSTSCRIATHPRHILSLDIGGTFLKASVVNSEGDLEAPFMRLPTPYEPTPDTVIACVSQMLPELPAFDRIAIAFPGAVKDGRILTAPNLGSERWAGHNFIDHVSACFGCDARMLNDAVVQGLGVVKGPGLECILTLGTGLGTAIFFNQRLVIQLELGRHIALGNQNYDEFVGQAAYETEGAVVWNERVMHTLAAVSSLTNYDHLYIGGGNAKRIAFPLDGNITPIPATAGVSGGAYLWKPTCDYLFEEKPVLQI
jgi:polyphosphate glucokinase